MLTSQTSGDTTRARLQLALGAVAHLGAELARGGRVREFAGTGRDGDALLVTLHESPPGGPSPDQLEARIELLRGVGHRAVAVPFACGALDGSAWQVERAPRGITARERLRRGPIGISQGVTALRDMARALVTLHRRGVAHGAVGLDTVRLVGAEATMCGAAAATAPSVRGDLDALGTVIWALLTGETGAPANTHLSDFRRGVPPALDALCAALLDGSPARRPQRAETILSALDVIPTRRFSPLAAIVDAGAHDVRAPRSMAWVVAAAALLVVAALVALNLR